MASRLVTIKRFLEKESPVKPGGKILVPGSPIPTTEFGKEIKNWSDEEKNAAGEHAAACLGVNLD